MPKLNYKIGYIDLRQDTEMLFSKIDCRTEVRKAEKSQVIVQVVEHGLTKTEQEECAYLLKRLLHEERVPYDQSFDNLLARQDVFQFLAYQGSKLVSFITVEATDRNQVLKDFKTAYLALSATAYEAKRDCPNYLLIWKAVKYLKEKGFEVFNLGLLGYIDSPDEAVHRVAFFKRKWCITEVVMDEQASVGKWFYYRFLKRFSGIRKILYSIKRVLHH
jgi:uncharacterized protein (UPF0297 family)